MKNSGKNRNKNENHTTFKNEVRKFCRKRLAVKQCFALAQSYEKHTAGLP